MRVHINCYDVILLNNGRCVSIGESQILTQCNPSTIVNKKSKARMFVININNNSI